MRLLLYTFLFLISIPGFCFSGSVIRGEIIPVANDSSLFFPVVNRTMILRGLEPNGELFGNLEKHGKGIDRIRKIPISFLAPFGLKEGMSVQYIEEEDGVRYSYKLNKMVNVILVHKDPMDENVKTQPYWARFNLVLTDDISNLRTLAADGDNFEIPRGIAYIGTEKKLQSSKPEKNPTSKLKKDDPIYNIQSFSKSGEDIRVADVLKNKIYVQPFKSEVDDGNYITTAIKTKDGKLYWITPNNDLLDAKFDNLILDSWIEGYKTKLYKDPYNDDSCIELLLISQEIVEEVRMKCKLGKN